LHSAILSRLSGMWIFLLIIYICMTNSKGSLPQTDVNRKQFTYVLGPAVVFSLTLTILSPSGLLSLMTLTFISYLRNTSCYILCFTYES